MFVGPQLHSPLPSRRPHGPTAVRFARRDQLARGLPAPSEPVELGFGVIGDLTLYRFSKDGDLKGSVGCDVGAKIVMVDVRIGGQEKARKLGHDLSKALEHAEAKGLSLSRETKSVIGTLSRLHMDHRFRYTRFDEYLVYAFPNPTAKSPFVFTSERGTPFTTAGFARMVERVGEAATLGFKVHPHMLRHACGDWRAPEQRWRPAIAG